ncbi:hypothetical protein BC829DRAFT_442144 [Chytridium lagenaria]|nr:hypothetical protein BC829DRAFT_442144 [Chytridium lagenaria]
MQLSKQIVSLKPSELLWVLDALCQLGVKVGFKAYIDLVRQDLDWIFSTVVPDDDEGGLSNIIKVWKNKNIFNSAELESVEQRLSTFHAKAPVLQDRDRHKRAREDGWFRNDAIDSHPNSPTLKRRRSQDIDLKLRTKSPKLTPTDPATRPRSEFDDIWDRTLALSDLDFPAIQEAVLRKEIAAAAAANGVKPPFSAISQPSPKSPAIAVPSRGMDQRYNQHQSAAYMATQAHIIHTGMMMDHRRFCVIAATSTPPPPPYHQPHHYHHSQHHYNQQQGYYNGGGGGGHLKNRPMSGYGYGHGPSPMPPGVPGGSYMGGGYGGDRRR